MFTVTIYKTPMSFPLNFTCHTWVEISHSERPTRRFDYWGYPGLKPESADHGFIYENLFSDHLGTTLSPFANPKTTQSRQVGQIHESITGPENSPAHRLYTAIDSKAFDYPYKHTYRMISGPNCNTYIQWLLKLEPAAKLTLPWNAWGKNSQRT